MQHHCPSQEIMPTAGRSALSMEADEGPWMPDVPSGPGYTRTLASQDLRMQMMAFVRGTEENEHPCRLAARLDAIITLTRELCTNPSQSRGRRGVRGIGTGAHRPGSNLSPEISRILRNLDALRSVLEDLQCPQPTLRHALDPLLVAFVRGEFSSN